MFRTPFYQLTPPEQKARRQKQWANQLIRQARKLKEENERPFHHVQNARRLNRLSLGLSQTGINGI